MPKILVAFAMQQEFAPWRRRRRFRKITASVPSVYTVNFGSTEVYVALSGAGAPDAPALLEVTKRLMPSAIVVTGVAAGLKPEWRPGHVLAAEEVSSPGGESRIRSAAELVDGAVQCGARRAPRLLTLPRIARSVAEKQTLSRRGDAADMESLPLMQLWSLIGIPALALRVILDPAEMPMTCDFEAAMDAHGQVRIARILRQLLRHPQQLADFLHLARESRRALAILARFLDRFCDHLSRRAGSP